MLESTIQFSHYYLNYSSTAPILTRPKARPVDMADGLVTAFSEEPLFIDVILLYFENMMRYSVCVRLYHKEGCC